MRATSEVLPPEALSRLSNLGLVARWIVEGFITGLHRSPFHGSSVEFAEYRTYVPGDDLRNLDWKALARSDKKFVKKFESETNVRCHVLLDVSASMDFGAPVTKLRYGASIAAAIAYLMTLQQDATGLTLFADEVVRHLKPRSSWQHFHDVIRVLGKLETRKATKVPQALHRLAEQVQSRGLFVIVSDLHDDPDAIVAGLRHLRFARHEVILFHVLDHQELAFDYRTLTEFRDLETGERITASPAQLRDAYRASVEDLTGRLRRACSGLAVDYKVIDTATPFDQVLAAYLHKRRRLG